MKDKNAPFRVVAAFVGDDHLWHVAVSDGKMRAVGHGGRNFGECLRKAVAEFRRHPLPHGELPEPMKPMGRWAYVDTQPTEGPEGEQWGQVYAWSDEEKGGPDIVSLEGELGICVPALGATCARWKGKQWIRLPDDGEEFLRDVGDAFQDDDWSTDDENDTDDTDVDG